MDQPPTTHQPPNTSHSHHPTKNNKPLIIGVVIGIIVLVIVGIGVASFSLLEGKKKDLKTHTQKQLRNFSKLDKTYDQIITAIRDIEEESEEEAIQTYNQLQENTSDEEEGYSESNVLGLEESVTDFRKIGELYKGAQSINQSIESTTQEVEKIYQGFPLASLLPQNQELLAETKDFSTKTGALLIYMNDSNQLDIKGVSIGYEIGAALVNALDNLGEEDIEKLDRKIKEIEALEKAAEDMDTSQVPEKVKKAHEESLKELRSQKDIFVDISQSIKDRDAAGLEDSVERLIETAVTDEEVSRTETISFWTDDPLILQVDELTTEWKAFDAEL